MDNLIGQLISKHYVAPFLGYGTAAAAGLGGVAVDGLQGDDQRLTDNTFIDASNDAVGYGAIGAGVGAASVVPGYLKTSRVQGTLNDNLGNQSAASRVRAGNALADARSGLRGRAVGRAAAGAGITAAGAGLLNLAKSFGRDDGNFPSGEVLSVGALLSGVGLAHMATEDMFRTPATDADLAAVEEMSAPRRKRTR